MDWLKINKVSRILSVTLDFSPVGSGSRWCQALSGHQRTERRASGSVAGGEAAGEQGGRWLGGHGAVWWRPNQCRGGRSEGQEMSLGFASVGFFEFLEFPPAPGPGARSSWPRFLSSVDHSRGLRLSVSR